MAKIFRITFNDGVYFDGRTPVEVVENMKNRNYFTEAKSIPTYMRGYSRRAIRVFRDTSIDTSSPGNFLFSLMMSPEVAKVEILEEYDD